VGVEGAESLPVGEPPPDVVVGDCVAEPDPDPDVDEVITVPEDDEEVEVEPVDEDPGGGAMPMFLIVNLPDAFPLSPNRTRI
jgi:hypothetical protein